MRRKSANNTVSFRHFFEVSIDTEVGVYIKEGQTGAERLMLRLGPSLSCAKGFLRQLTALGSNGGLGAQDILFPWTRAFLASQVDQKVLGSQEGPLLLVVLRLRLLLSIEVTK